jgi:hypothetical protein
MWCAADDRCVRMSSDEQSADQDDYDVDDEGGRDVHQSNSIPSLYLTHSLLIVNKVLAAAATE